MSTSRDSFGRPAASLAGVARTTCDDCGSAIVWMRPAALASRIDPEELGRLEMVLSGIGDVADGWLCPDCGNWGVIESGVWHWA